MNNDSIFSDGCWSLMRRELVVWLVIVIALGATSLAGHGHLKAREPQVQVAGIVPQSSRSSADVSWRLDLNSATAVELEMLPGIGPRRAQSIVQERSRRGAFTNIWELREVPGLTPSLIQRLEPLLKVTPARSAR